MDCKKIIILGATSGIGRELAIVFSENNYQVGITGRRENLLTELAQQLKNKSFTSSFDIRNTETAIASLNKLIKDMNGVDIIIINSGAGFINPNLDWQLEKDTIDTNVSGFTAMANSALIYFIEKGSGHLAAVSSIASLMPNRQAPAYSASKAYISLYLKSLRCKVIKEKLPIHITDIIPGFVDTAMAKGDGLFWVAQPRKAAMQIFSAIEGKKKNVYITKRWRLVAALIKLIPASFFAKL